MTTQKSGRHLVVPLGGRVSGGATFARPCAKKYPDNKEPATGCAIGVVDTGLVLHDGRPHCWIADHVVFDPKVDEDPLPPAGSGAPLGSTGHGTFVTGVILHEAPTAKVTMKGVLDKETGDAEDKAVADAIDALCSAGIKLINLSFGGDKEEQGPPPGIGEALSSLGEDVVVVVAAGNSGTQQPFYPAAFELGAGKARMIAVGAVDARHHRSTPVADFSNHGRWVSAYASGVDVLGPYLGFADGTPGFTGWATWSGTSFASAVVTGRIAHCATAEGISVAEAAERVVGSPKIPVWGVNGQAMMPYVASGVDA